MFISQTGQLSANVKMMLNPQVPVYLIKGPDKWAIVDTGMMFLAPELVAQLRREGADGAMLFIVLTHSHFDHVGGLAALKREFPHAVAVSGAATADVLKKKSAVQFIRATNDNYVKLLKLEEKYPDFDFEIQDEIDIDVIVGQNDKIDLGGNVTLIAHEVAGHSKCSMAFFLEPDKAIFSGEAAGFYNGPHDIVSEGLSDYSGYLSSLAGMRDLKAEIICLPHNGALTGDDALAYFDDAIRCGENFRRKIAERLERNEPEEKIMSEIGAEFYKGLIENQPRDVFNINLRAMIKAIAREMK